MKWKEKTWAQVSSISSIISFSIRIYIYIYIYIVITVTIKLLSVFSRWIWWKHGGFWSCDRPGGSYRQKEFKVLYHIILFELACLLTYPFFRFSMGFIPVWCWCIPARSSSVSHGFAALVLAMDCFALYSKEGRVSGGFWTARCVIFCEAKWGINRDTMIWLVRWNMNFIFHILGILQPQLTKSYFSEG